jgi:FMN-dependent NADH-azoreductase
LLHVDASARRRSISRAVSAAFADAWRAQRPDGGYVYRDLATDPVAHLREGHERSYALALESARSLGKEY